MGATYEQDVVAWANEQATLLRSGKLSAIDIENIAEEIEDVGRGEKRELANRMAVLLAHLLKWKFQSNLRCPSWEITIKEQRKAIKICLKEMPSLKTSLSNEGWISSTWSDAVTKAAQETGLGKFPEALPWSFEQVLSQDFYPD